jgi:hypothetical protein
LFVIVDGAAVGRRLRPVVRPVVAHHLGDAQAVVGEHPGAPERLHAPVVEVGAPAPDGLVVAPELQGEELAFLVEALEALDRDEAVDLLDFRAQGRGEPQVVVPAARGRPELEDDGHHGGGP